jgi:hypothetical protein
LEQRLLADPRTAKREERFVDDGPFVVADTQTAEFDSAKRTSVRRPSATARSRRPSSCGASPSTAECDVRASRAGWLPHHSRGRQARRPDGTAVGRVRTAGAEFASIRARASCASFRLASVRRIASGTPCPSPIRCRLLPRLARSVGLGPVCVPPHTALRFICRFNRLIHWTASAPCSHCCRLVL